MIVSPIWESVGFHLVIRMYCTKKDKLNTGEVGFEPTTGILEIPILPIKLHSYSFSLRPSRGRRPGTRGSSRERKELIPGIEPGFGY